MKLFDGSFGSFLECDSKGAKEQGASTICLNPTESVLKY